MNKLGKKLFLTLSLLLSLFIVTILIIFNTQSYLIEKRNIEDSLNTMQRIPNGKIQDDKIISDKELIIKDDEKDNPRMFMDKIIYTIDLDENNKIEKIISHSPNFSEEEIREYAESLLAQKDILNVSIGNLYFTNYSYKYESGCCLTIIDNTETNESLVNNLKISIVIFLLAEILIVIISRIITKWIIKPVEESFNKQKQFIADASHELKTPIAVIMSNLETYEIDKKQKWLGNISNETERMNHLIKNLLDLAKLENGSKENYTSNNLSKIVDKQVLTFESVMFEKNIELDSKIDENITINSNADELKQLVSIIIDNAIKHSPEKGGNVKVNLTTKSNKIILEISNKGNPIPKGEEEKIFERFYRGDESRNRNANRYGLGLAIAKNIVLKHNGTIKAYSENGYTTFQIVFKK